MAEEHTPLQRCLAASDKNRRPCHTQVSHNWLYHLDANAGSVLTPHDYITNVQKKSATDFGWVVGSVDAAVSSQTWNMQKPAAHPKLRGDTTLRSRCVLWSETRGPWNYYGLTASHSRPADIFTTAAVSGRSAALDVCVASIIAGSSLRRRSACVV